MIPSAGTVARSRNLGHTFLSNSVLVNVPTVIGEEPGGVGDPGEELGERRRRRLVIPTVAQFSGEHEAESQISQWDRKCYIPVCGAAAQLLAGLDQVAGSTLNVLKANVHLVTLLQSLKVILSSGSKDGLIHL